MKRKRRRARSGALGEVTKKDFQAIAGILCSHGASDGQVSAFANYFASQNPRFNAAIFKKFASCKR